MALYPIPCFRMVSICLRWQSFMKVPFFLATKKPRARSLELPDIRLKTVLISPLMNFAVFPI